MPYGKEGEEKHSKKGDVAFCGMVYGGVKEHHMPYADC